jgi:hypothetical protein
MDETHAWTIAAVDIERCLVTASRTCSRRRRGMLPRLRRGSGRHGERLALLVDRGLVHPRRRQVAVRSSSRAAIATVFPESRTRRTASALNSGVNRRRLRSVTLGLMDTSIMTGEGQVQRDRLPAAGRARLGPLQRRQRHEPLPRVGARGVHRPHPGDPAAALRRRHHRAPPRSRRPDLRLRPISRRRLIGINLVEVRPSSSSASGSAGAKSGSSGAVMNPRCAIVPKRSRSTPAPGGRTSYAHARSSVW